MIRRDDPSAVFARLRDEPIAAEELDRLSAAVERALDAEGRPAHPVAVPAPPALPAPGAAPARRAWARAAWTAAAVLVLGLAAGLVWDALAPGPAPAPATGAAGRPVEVAATTTSADREAAAAALGLGPGASGGAALHAVEVLDTPGEAQVVDFSVGETRVVMIFDKELDL